MLYCHRIVRFGIGSWVLGGDEPLPHGSYIMIHAADKEAGYRWRPEAAGAESWNGAACR